MKDIKIKQIFHIIFAVAVTGLFLRMFVVDTFEVKGDSMAPVILKGDYVFVDKASHRFRFKGGDYIFNRQDIIVAKARRQSGQIIKRIIGLPGDRLEITNNGNGILIKKDRKDEGEPIKEDYISNPAVSIPVVGLGAIKLDPKEYYVLGDNRYFSVDSRELGPVDEWDIEGRVFLIFRPSSFSFKTP